VRRKKRAKNIAALQEAENLPEVEAGGGQQRVAAVTVRPSTNWSQKAGSSSLSGAPPFLPFRGSHRHNVLQPMHHRRESRQIERLRAIRQRPLGQGEPQ